MKTTIALLALLLPALLWAQRDDLPTPKEKKSYAQASIIDLKERGAMVLRLRTDHRKIALLNQTLASDQLTPQQRKHHENLLEGTLRRRDGFNQALYSAFTRTFDFCPVYVIYDTSTTHLKAGKRAGFFLNEKQAVDPSIELKESAIFLVNFKDKSAEFPYDVLRVRRLEEKLEEPFPYVVPIRASWLRKMNSPRAAKSVELLQNKLVRYHQRVLQQKAKEATKNPSATPQS